ncbi:unnamed protein product, partial [marine sediment metagenome]
MATATHRIADNTARARIVAVVLALAVAAAQSTVWAASARRLNQEGIEAYATGDFAQAADRFEQAQAKAPDNL